MISINNNINALILVGGKSTRMGVDKSNLTYFNKPQIDHVFDLLKELVPKENIYYSVRKNQTLENKLVITDEFPNLGPFGAIYSAFKYDNTKAWLVLAIDIPYISVKVLKYLFNNRNTNCIATTFQGKDKKYPEPLITIYETTLFPILKENLKNNTLSLINILKSNKVELIKIDDSIIQNINYKEDYEKVRINLNKELNN